MYFSVYVFPVIEYLFTYCAGDGDALADALGEREAEGERLFDSDFDSLLEAEALPLPDGL